MPVLGDFFVRLPAFAQELALDLYGRRMRAARYSGVHQDTLRALRQSERWSAEQHRAHQLDELNALIEFAGSTVALYESRLKDRGPLRSLDDLRTIPTVTKDDIRRAGRSAVSREWELTSLAAIHTGGTTGAPLTVYCLPAAIQKNYAFFERFREMAGVGDGCRVATFAGRVFMPANAGPPFSRRNRAFNARLFSSYHLSAANLPHYADELAAWSPAMIDSYPSSLAPIAQYLLRAGDVRVRPKAVITSSETLEDRVRGQIEAAFGCRVFDHYGAAEMAALITQCEHGSYHVNPEFGVVEIEVDQRAAVAGEEGEIIATGFLNRAMPFIRYRTGDRATWDPRPCACGRAMPRIAYIGGRVDDVIITPDGRMIGRLDPIFKVASAMFETRIVQDAEAHLRIEIASATSVPASDVEAIVSALRSRVGDDMAIDVAFVPSLPRTRAGKLRSVVNEFRRVRSAAGGGD